VQRELAPSATRKLKITEFRRINDFNSTLKWNCREMGRVRYHTYFAKIVGPPPNLRDDLGIMNIVSSDAWKAAHGPFVSFRKELRRGILAFAARTASVQAAFSSDRSTLMFLWAF
jgi:hypothetical protein